MLPTALTNARAEHDEARSVSIDLRKTYEALSRRVEPEVEPDEEQVRPDPQASLQLASLGIELAEKEKQTIRLERDVVRYLSAGDDLWRHRQKKSFSGQPGIVRLIEPCRSGLPECVLALYRKSDGLSAIEKEPIKWREDAMTYYTGSPKPKKAWCHISGTVFEHDDVKAAHIVPFFLDTADIGEILFGSRAESLLRAGNSLLLYDKFQKWFDTDHIVVIPVDAKEVPIKRWKMEIISPDIRNTVIGLGIYAWEYHGKELAFLNEKRPVSRFLYFHFIMTLVRIKDLRRPGWEDVWARFYNERPFPTPTHYMRRSMLLAITTHYGTTDMNVVNSWIRDNGFDAPLQLTDDEATEAARRVLSAIDFCAEKHEKGKKKGDEDYEAGEDDDAEEEEGEEDEDDKYYEDDEDSEGDEGDDGRYMEYLF
ncbi:hypothetical protein GGR54DRAFT_654390 [Hypoxylon sp. NC1633]|nr:hypothetical protein GGR54DRAFT_654390 [Hypoxylon sp. NC1633]